MRNRNILAGAAVALLCFLAACGEVFVSTSGAGASGGSGGSGAAGSGDGAQGGGATATGPGGGVPACDAPPGADECKTCLFESCQERYCACADEGDCTGIFDCKGAGNMLEYCWQNNANGVSLWGLLTDCGAEKCPSCGFVEVDDCQACQYDHCPEQINACYSKDKCRGYLECVRDCKMSGGTDSTCGNTCYGDGAGVSEAGKLIECVKGSCGDPCML